MRRFVIGLFIVSAMGVSMPAGAKLNCYPMDQSLCDFVGVGLPVAPVDPQIAIADGSYAPKQVTVRAGGNLVFHSFDTIIHGVQDKRCFDTPTLACRFATKAVKVGERGPTAVRVPINGFPKSSVPVEYICFLHGEVGEFVVV